MSSSPNLGRRLARWTCGVHQPAHSKKTATQRGDQKLSSLALELKWEQQVQVKVNKTTNKRKKTSSEIQQQRSTDMSFTHHRPRKGQQPNNACEQQCLPLGGGYLQTDCMVGWHYHSGNLPSSCPVLLVQFDGFCHSHSKAGGVGVAALQVTANDTFLTHGSSTAIPNCPDNIIAEAHACRDALLPAVRLYEGVSSHLLITRTNPQNWNCTNNGRMSATCVPTYRPCPIWIPPKRMQLFSWLLRLDLPLPSCCPSLDTTTSSYSLLHQYGFKVDHAEANIALTLNEQPQFLLDCTYSMPAP